MRHFDVDFRDKNGERYQLSKRIAELTEALMANYFVYDTEVLEGVWFRDGKFTYEQREEGRGFRSTQSMIPGAMRIAMRG